jgi:hypothetical protein
MHLYATAPIDYFAAFMPAEVYYDRLVAEESATADRVAAAHDYVDFCVRLICGYTTYGGDADHRAGPFVTALPDAEGTPEGSLIVTLKGENNGTVYIASQFPLAWLEDRKVAIVDSGSGPDWPNDSW